MPTSGPTKSPSSALEPFDALDWFQSAGAFRVEEFVAAYEAAGRKRSSAATLLKHHVAQKNLANIRRGLYCITENAPHRFIIACKMTDDAVLAYDGAASYHDMMEMDDSITVLTRQRFDDVNIDDVEYRNVAAEDPRHEPQVIRVRERNRHDVYVTTKERTLVDLVDRPELGRSTQHIVQAFRRAGRVSMEEMLKRVKKLDTAVTAARLGFFLEHMGPRFKPLLPELEKLRPQTPVYFRRADSRDPHFLLRRWNLVAPQKLVLSLERGK